MDNKQLQEAYEFLQQAHTDYTQAEKNYQKKSVIKRVQNYMIGKNELSFLLLDGDTAFCSFNDRYIEGDFNSALRTLRNQLSK